MRRADLGWQLSGGQGKNCEMLPISPDRRRRVIAIAYVLIVTALAVLVAVPEHPSFAAYAGMMLLAAPLSLLLYLPYYLISLGVLPVDGPSWLWLFHVAWYTAIAAVQARLAVKYLDRRQQRDKAAA
jgi:hypothetical protein